MKIRKGSKLACSYGLVAAMVVTSATGYQVKNVSAADQYGIAVLDGEVAVPEGYTLLNEGWNPLGFLKDIPYLMKDGIHWERI